MDIHHSQRKTEESQWDSLRFRNILSEVTEPLSGGAGTQSQLCLIPKPCVGLTRTDYFSSDVCQIRSLDITLAGNDFVTPWILWVILWRRKPLVHELWLNILSLITLKYAAVLKWKGASPGWLWHVSSPVECFWFVDDVGKTLENTSSS